MLNFTLKQLRYIEAAGRLGSIAKAAQEQSISQSSITTAIDALEQELGHSLFVRTPAKGIMATPSGRESLLLIRSFIDRSKHFEGEITSVGGDVQGAIRIGCYATAAPSFLPPILKGFTEKFPNISIKLFEGNMQTIMEFLADGVVDLNFTYAQVLDERSEFVPLFDAPPYAVIAADDPFAKQDHVTYEDLSKRPMIMLDLPNTRDYFIEMFEERGFALNVAHSTRSSEMARALVSGGFGFSVLNIKPVDYEKGRSGYVCVPIFDAELEFQSFGIATQSAVYQPSIVQAFVQYCEGLKHSGVFEGMTVQ